MRFQGSVIREQGVTFAIVIVKPYVIENRTAAGGAIFTFSRFFPRMPLVLMAQDALGTRTYFGRRDIVDFLADVSLDRIPWKEYTAA